jgi:hypothetical protein
MRRGCWLVFLGPAVCNSLSLGWEREFRPGSVSGCAWRSRLWHAVGLANIYLLFDDSLIVLFSRGRRQFLNAQRFEELRRVWLTHGIPTFVARKLDGLMDYGGWDSL